MALRVMAYYKFSQGHSARVPTANVGSAFKANVVHYSNGF